MPDVAVAFFPTPFIIEQKLGGLNSSEKTVAVVVGNVVLSRKWPPLLRVTKRNAQI